MADVIFSELNCSNDCKIGVIELNNPKSLNALTLNMIRSLHQKLRQWESNSKISFIILQGSGDKAFCAGGDVVSLYKAINIVNESCGVLSDNVILKHPCNDFFEEEYKLDLYIHEYEKPILAWGDGYVFGGGLGLFAGASHRITTQRSIMAMPEAAIGLYPDVGASWFFNQMPNRLGLFLGITGTFFNTSDAKYLGLSDFSIKSNQKENVIEYLKKIDWSIESNISAQLDNVLKEFEFSTLSTMPVSSVQINKDLLASIMSGNNIDSIYDEIINTQFEDNWLVAAQEKLCKASILSIKLTFTQFELTQHYSKSECFNSELNLSLRCSQYTEFPEGVRAQLVEKDKNPQWAFKNLDEITPELVSWFFTPVSKI